MWLKEQFTHGAEPCTIDIQSSAGQAPDTLVRWQRCCLMEIFPHVLQDWQLECSVRTDFSSPHVLFHHVCVNPAPGVKRGEQAGVYSPDKHKQTTHTNNSRPLHTVQLGRVLTDTSQQQLYPKQNTEDNNERGARPVGNYFSAAAIYSGCRSILPLRFNSCPLIYNPNLATIKIPELLVNSLSLFSSTSRPRFVSFDNYAMWCK